MKLVLLVKLLVVTWLIRESPRTTNHPSEVIAVSSNMDDMARSRSPSHLLTSPSSLSSSSSYLGCQWTVSSGRWEVRGLVSIDTSASAAGEGGGGISPHLTKARVYWRRSYTGHSLSSPKYLRGDGNNSGGDGEEDDSESKRGREEDKRWMKGGINGLTHGKRRSAMGGGARLHRRRMTTPRRHTTPTKRSSPTG